MPQFGDAEQVLAHLRGDRFRQRCAKRGSTSTMSASPRSRSANRRWTGPLRSQKGVGPDRLLMMVSTEEQHHFANSAARCRSTGRSASGPSGSATMRACRMCGTVSTIWGSPIGGAHRPEGCGRVHRSAGLRSAPHDIEHADHDGSASAPHVYRYFSMILDAIPDTGRCTSPTSTRPSASASASILAALQAGITHFEATLGGLGGQPANFLGDCPIKGTGEYYYDDPALRRARDCIGGTAGPDRRNGHRAPAYPRQPGPRAVAGREAGEHGGKRLRSRPSSTAVTEGGPHEIRAPGLQKVKDKLEEAPGQKLPADWGAMA